MRKTKLLFVFVITTMSMYAQSGEFTIYRNGLIYDSATIFHLANIVDSLNLSFSFCELKHSYEAIPQGIGHHVKVPGKTALKLIKSGVSFDEYKSKYPLSVKERNLYIVQYRYVNYKGAKVIEYSGLPGTQTPSISVSDKPSNDKIKGWVLNDGYAFYLEHLVSKEVPRKYSNLIQYVDCMVDTTTQIYFSHAEGEVYQTVEEGSTADLFLQWSANFPNAPEYPDYEDDNFDSLYTEYQKQYQKWDSLRLIDIDEKMKNSRFRMDQLKAAKDEAIETGNSDDRLEFYVGRYLSKKDALNMKRGRRVIGGCSMDDSPRWHAVQICMLAAESYQWDVFLRSHLDVMNDRFDRMSDGSYAWQQRQTYIKELEVLGINAVDLLLGSIFRVSNGSRNHYYGSVNRIGRALSETTNKDAVEKMMFAAVKDKDLDLNNRVLMMYLLLHYNFNLTEDERKENNKKHLSELQASLPTELVSVIEKMD